MFFYNLPLWVKRFNKVWNFGWNAGVDFNQSIPVGIVGSAIHTGEGCASISDINGNLLFYTDGISVWDSFNNQMPNGVGLMGGMSATQSALIIAKPNSNSIYYIFTVEQIGNSGNFSYSVVDMTLNNGNGDVSVKNIHLISAISEKQTAVLHSNGIDVWVMVHGENNNSFYAFLVTANGVVLNPTISSIGATLANGDSQGCMKFSPNGQRIAFVANISHYVDLFDFDASSGAVSNEKYLFPGAAYGIEFSVSGNYLYGSFNYPPEIYQWDLTSNIQSVINSTRQLIGYSSNNFLGALQLSFDGKIYLAESNETHLGVINNPEAGGLQCNFIDTGVVLGNGYCMLGLPNYVQSEFLTGNFQNESPRENFYLRPNPFTDYLYFDLVGNQPKKVLIVIKNIYGQIILNEFYREKADLRWLSNGVYFVEALIDGRKIIKKIIKQ